MDDYFIAWTHYVTTLTPAPDTLVGCTYIFNARVYEYRVYLVFIFMEICVFN